MTNEQNFDSMELMETIQATLDHLTRENPMGEPRKDALMLNFDRKLKLEFHGTKVTSDAGLLAYRKLDDALGLTTSIDADLCDNRTGKNTQHSISALLRQAIYSRLALPKKTRDWSLRTLQVKLIKIGAKVIRHARYVMFQMAEVAVPRALFCEILERLSRLTLAAVTPGIG